MNRSGIPLTDFDDIVVAESLQGGGVIARNVALRLGLPHVPGLADNRHCAAGLSAVQIGAGSIRAGMDRVVVAGGTESLSSMPRTLKSTPGSAHDYQPWMSPSHPETPDAPLYDMSITVGENTARAAGLTRESVDEWAYHSHQRAAASVANGWFEEEIVRVGSFAVDENPRADTTMERLASLPALHPEIEGATVTAGNASGLNDGAAAIVMVADDYASANGITPLARIISWASVGDDPARTGLTPIIAIPKALERAGMKVGDVDLFEINEAFAAVAIGSMAHLGVTSEIVNVNGGAIAVGHPLGMSGNRLALTAAHELRRRGGGIAAAALCGGGGQGDALVMRVAG
jgi:acetyl-CoA C-acetyltransferase